MPINNFLLPGAKFTPAFKIDNSCRFNDGDSPQLSKSVGSSATTKHTLSLWIKRGAFGSYQRFLTSTGGGGLGDVYYRFNDDDTMEFSSVGDDSAKLILNRKFRDPAAWMHFVVRYDSTESTTTDRFRLYVNGVDERSVGGYSTSTMPNSSEADNIVASGNTLRIGATASAQYFDGYMAEVHFSEGYSYAPTEFGEFDEDSPTIWKPKEASISYGTSGFYLDFADSSNLGNDKNGGTDLDETNIAATDSSTDTPTNNFATFNPLNNNSTLTEANTIATTDNAQKFGASSTLGVSTGKWFWEGKCNAAWLYIGVDYDPAEALRNNDPIRSHGWCYQDYDGQIYNNGSGSSFGDTFTTNDIIGIALDVTNSKLYFSKNGTWQDSGDPTSGATGTGAISIPANKTYFASMGDAGTSVTSGVSINFGNPPYANSSDAADADGYGAFEYAPPSGYFALCTKNLAEYG